jgi:hypothetical protein
MVSGDDAVDVVDRGRDWREAVAETGAVLYDVADDDTILCVERRLCL